MNIGKNRWHGGNVPAAHAITIYFRIAQNQVTCQRAAEVYDEEH